MTAQIGLMLFITAIEPGRRLLQSLAAGRIDVQAAIVLVRDADTDRMSPERCTEKARRHKRSTRRRLLQSLSPCSELTKQTIGYSLHIARHDCPDADLLSACCCSISK